MNECVVITGGAHTATTNLLWFDDHVMNNRSLVEDVLGIFLAWAQIGAGHIMISEWRSFTF